MHLNAFSFNLSELNFELVFVKCELAQHSHGILAQFTKVMTVLLTNLKVLISLSTVLDLQHQMPRQIPVLITSEPTRTEGGHAPSRERLNEQLNLHHSQQRDTTPFGYNLRK